MCGKTLSLSYGRFFAEFLGDFSLVRLGLLDQNTCFGLRYGSLRNKLRREVGVPTVTSGFREFSWKAALHYLSRRSGTFSLPLESALKPGPGFSREPSFRHERQIR